MTRAPTRLFAVLALAACHPTTPATFDVRPAVSQLQVTHATPGDTLEAVDAMGAVVQSGIVDTLGSLMFRNLPPGDGYVVRLQGTMPPEQTQPLTVMSVGTSTPDPATYAAQKLVPGFNYLHMRDGTTLSAWVTLPGSADLTWPTVVNYSGYDPSRPGQKLQGYDFLCPDFPILCDAPEDGTALLAGLFGYATVSVNIRGTGCSGGAFDYFETMQVLDAYDIIEIVAAQSWARHHAVGMVGLSYPGITQLFTAGARPPHLAAIAPMSVIGNTASTLLPGGILNDGFALSWVDNVLIKAVPYGQGWEAGQVDGGDTTCAENQLLHGQLVDNVAQARMTQFYDPTLHDRLNPTTFVHQIDVPVFLTGAWQDEQTGPFFFTLFPNFTHAPALRLNTFNGVHIDGVQPAIIAEWQAFLELFVAQRLPLDPMAVRNFSPFIFNQVFSSMQTLPTTKWPSFASREEALAAWMAEPPIRALFESGAGDPNDLGAPVPTFEVRFGEWPPKETNAVRYYFHADGGLSGSAPTETDSSSTFRLDPDAGERGILQPGGDVWDKMPAYDWPVPPPGDAVVMETAPLAADTMFYGTASADLWLQSPVDDADLEVNLSEVRADGKEVYVQSGWMRASYGKPGADATELWPDQTFEEKDWALLQPGAWNLVRVGTAGFGHVFRAGSKIRLSVDTPGGSRALWRFALKQYPMEVRYTIGHDATHASSLVLPRIDGVAIGGDGGTPPCGSLRGQPCR
jgi:predicted acyl esterase